MGIKADHRYSRKSTSTTHKTSHRHRTSSPSRTYRYKSDGGVSSACSCLLEDEQQEDEDKYDSHNMLLVC